MATLDTAHVDLECGRRSSAGGGATNEDEEEGSVCFSCNSQFFSIADGDGDGSYEGLGSRKASSCESVDLESGLSNPERDCRICHLSLISSSPGYGIAIDLGCSCKDDLAASHKHCADTWFKIKGNKTCEICNSIARNVVSPNNTEPAQEAAESDAVEGNTAMSSASETGTCFNGHRFLNFLLACMVFAFIISWLFHFNIPS